MTGLSEQEFEKMVARTLDDLPPHIQEKLENIAVCMELRPTREQLHASGTRRDNVLLGLYEGVPKTEWGRGFGGNLPDKITIFQESLEQCAGTPEQFEDLVRSTVRHEIAHHFGYTDEELDSL